MSSASSCAVCCELAEPSTPWTNANRTAIVPIGGSPVDESAPPLSDDDDDDDDPTSVLALDSPTPVEPDEEPVVSSLVAGADAPQLPASSATALATAACRGGAERS